MWGGSCVNGKKNEMEILNQNNLDLLRSESIKHEQHSTYSYVPKERPCTFIFFGKFSCKLTLI